MSLDVAVTEHTTSHLLRQIADRRALLAAAVVSGACPGELAEQVDDLTMLDGALAAAQNIEHGLRHAHDTEELLVVAESILRKSQLGACADDGSAAQMTGMAAGRAKVARVFIRAVESGRSLEEIRSAMGVTSAGAAA